MSRKSIICMVTAILMAMAMVPGAYALVPHFISYQGKLTRETPRGPIPLTGTYTVTFRIYDADGGGNILWGETRDVEVNQGIFNVTLGEVTPLDLLFDQDYWLGLQVDPDPEMTPRQRMVSTGYSYMAEDSYYLNGHATGSGNGLDADMVDGKHYSNIASEIDSDIDNHANLKTTHGITGEIVGTSDDQVLTNKHISGEQIDSGKIDNARLNMGPGNDLDADKVDGKHYSDIATEIDTDIDDHANLKTTHGVSGEIVGTSDDQVLTNKHISGEQIDSGKISNDRLNMGSGNGLDADTLDGYEYVAISGEIDNKIATHKTNWGHLTNTQKNDLTDGGDTTLHYHAGDRNLANATGVLDKSHLNSDQVQMRVTGACGSGYSIREIRSNGSVVCEKDDLNDAVSNPSGTYYSMKVGYASTAGSVSGASWIPLCYCSWPSPHGTENNLACPSRCHAVGGHCVWHIKVLGQRGSGWSTYCTD